MDVTTLACGIGCLRAVWMNRFATLKSFITVYSILGMVQSMSFVYFTVTLTTLERRFKIPGKVLGIVLSGNEVSQILLSLFLSYYGGNRNRPRWISFGTLLSALSCFVLALPHFIYGPGEDAIRLTYQYINKTGFKFVDEISKRKDPILHCLPNKEYESCQQDSYTSDLSITPLILIFMSQFILGIGTTLFYVLGQIYIDDNTKKKNTPKLIGISMSLRMIGPTFGFLLGFLCLRVYIDPSLDPIIKENDPRWMGAWWIGWIVCGVLMTLMSFILAMFPKQLPRKSIVTTTTLAEAVPLKKTNVTEVVSDVIPLEKSNLKDFPAALSRLLHNKLLMNNIFSAVFGLLGAAGFMTFLVKYLEIQYQRSSAKESLVAGPVILSGSIIGLMGSGILISRLKPPPKYLLFLNVLAGIIWIFSQFFFIFLGCNDNYLQNFSPNHNILQLDGDCNANCDCSGVKFSPVCYQPERLTYFSPCHAGCTNVVNFTKKYSNCGCLPAFAQTDTIQDGFCDINCNTVYYIFIMIMSVSHFASSSGRIGNMLVNYRCVEARDKAFAQGFALWMISVFALIPGPIIYGYLYDNACLIWDTRCSKRGNCWYYNKDHLRLTLNLTGICLTSLSVIFDFFVWRQGKNLNLYDDKLEMDKTNDKVELKSNAD